MSFSRTRVSALLLTTLLASAAQTTRPIAKTTAGEVRGTSAPGISAFKGIPYAAPPIGDLRWKAPVAAARWTGVRDAADFGTSCIQDLSHARAPWTEEFMTQNATGEDCLNLNVWTPVKAPFTSAPLPVYVFVHGGGFNEGSSSIAAYDASSLARHGVVVVTINYRMGALGYMAHPELTAESPHHSSGNYGLLDAVAALQWVQANIRNFGGDPNKVTFGGQSAGAMSVTDLSSSPMTKGLYRSAIVESGSAALGASAQLPTLQEGEAVGTKIAAALNAKSIADLRAMPASTFLGSKMNPLRAGRNLPLVDGWLLPQQPTAANLARPDLSVIIGMNADEGSSSAQYGKGTADEFTASTQKTYGDRAAALLSAYPAADTRASMIQSTRDRNQAAVLSWAQSASTHSAGGIYPYFFARGTPWPERPEFAAFHTSEVPYALGSLDAVKHPYTAQDRALSEEMQTYWANFIKTGNPNGKGLPQWQNASEGSWRIMRLDAAKSETVDAMSPQRLDIWKSNMAAK